MKIVEAYEAEDGTIHRTAQAARERDTANKLQELLAKHEAYGRLSSDQVVDILMDSGEGKVIFQLLKEVHGF